MSLFELYDKTFKYLEQKGFEVYPVGTKEGECKKDYIVLKKESSTQTLNYSSQTHYFSILCYSKKYTGVLKLCDNIREVMKEYFPQMKQTGNETPPYFDDSVNAFMVSIEYACYMRNKKL